MRQRMGGGAGMVILLSGLLLYFFARPLPPWIISLSGNMLTQAHPEAAAAVQAMANHFPPWLVYSLPDGLWAAAMVMLLLAVWDFRLDGAGLAWSLLGLLAGLSFEAGQALELLPGTYDPLDLVLIASCGALPILFTLRFCRSWEKTQGTLFPPESS